MCRDYTNVNTLLILPTTVLEQTMNNNIKCIMKSPLVIIFAIMKSVLDSSFCQAAMTAENNHYGVPLNQPAGPSTLNIDLVCPEKQGPKPGQNVNTDSYSHIASPQDTDVDSSYVIVAVVQKVKVMYAVLLKEMYIIKTRGTVRYLCSLLV